MSAVPKDAILVTGGAGYIGSHACKALARAGYLPVTYDNLSTGWEEAVKFGPREVGDLLDRARLGAVFQKYGLVAVIHFAALNHVGQSVQRPGIYWRNNVIGSHNLIEAAAAECLDFIFSSTCATYGDHDGIVLSEDTPQHPLNAYGKSKRAIEEMLADFERSAGIAERAGLTKRFLARKMVEYDALKAEIEELQSDVSEADG